MPVCQGCGGSYEDEYKFCPYCGRSKPETPKLEINVKVSEEAGKFTCPSCHRADKAQKVSAIIASQTKVSGNEVQYTTELAKRLSKFRPKPIQPKPNNKKLFYGVVCYFFALCCVIAIFAIASTGGNGNYGGPFLFGVLAFFGGRSLIKSGTVTKQDMAKYDTDLEEWKAAKQRYDSLFYCSGCDCVYVPQTESYAPVQNMGEYLYS